VLERAPQLSRMCSPREDQDSPELSQGALSLQVNNRTLRDEKGDGGDEQDGQDCVR
jgi:hypothetical protein